MKKKLFSLLLVCMMLISLAACGGNADNSASTDAAPDDAAEPAEETAETADDAAEPADDAAETADTDSDTAYVQGKGTLVVGITEFEPMDFQDETGNWIGFDADLARAFADSLGVEAVFQIVDWDNKVFELEGKTIDVVWNGMTLTDEVLNAMACSNAYFNNAQVMVFPAGTELADAKTQDVTVDSGLLDNLDGVIFAVESGSAGYQEAVAHELDYQEVADQATALLEVSSGTADGAIIDFLMAKAMTGEGTSYSNLVFSAGLNNEEYGVGFRQGSDLVDKLNDFFVAAYADGTMQEIAETYNIAEMLIPQE